MATDAVMDREAIVAGRADCIANACAASHARCHQVKSGIR
jgi:hypothetical protein